ncbi:hypothetical protein N177_3316 [Lutibaculum baratangense AMV1]|uniref:Uncharacterized protein n=1 Tax=Lutibaculum baratangense AMV1 TaxID=631454 RepID=V4T9R6_9HYPH|nr:hypothetical protein N177_3316 [Lutibaculum baratangense AMV1]
MCQTGEDQRRRAEGGRFQRSWKDGRLGGLGTVERVVTCA